jgi:hypothetical protein
MKIEDAATTATMISTEVVLPRAAVVGAFAGAEFAVFVLKR